MKPCIWCGRSLLIQTAAMIECDLCAWCLPDYVRVHFWMALSPPRRAELPTKEKP